MKTRRNGDMSRAGIDRSGGDRNGAAIVIVVGLLAVLMLTAVAFSISMRIERKSASNQRHGIQARHMLWSALANAIEDIDNELDGADGFKIYPEQDIIASTGATSRARVLSPISMTFVPGCMRDAVRAAQVNWRNIELDNHVRGRYAYLAVNSSGLLDANRVAGTNRLAGADPREIQIGNLPEIEDAAVFASDREKYVRFETLPELDTLNNGLKEDRAPEYFSVYSLAPVQEMMDSGYVLRQKAYIGPETDKWDKVAIKDAFSRSGVSDTETAFLSLCDYVDEDSVPTRFDAGCSEAVPMLNDIQMPLYRVTMNGDGTFSSTMGISLELFYPFLDANTDNYRVHYEVKFVNESDNLHPDLVPVGDISSPAEGVAVSGGIAPGTYIPVVGPVINHNGSTAQNGGKLHFSVYVAAKVQIEGGAVVDEVPSPYDVMKGVQLEVIVDNLAWGNTYTTHDWTECVDPRFNWDPQGGGAQRQWYRGKTIESGGFTMSLSSMNGMTKFFFDPVSYGQADTWDLDDDTAMHVANAPLQSIGELGYICYARWQTIRLYDHFPGADNPGGDVDYHTALDHFTLQLPAEKYARGLVNVNSLNIEALGAVFNGLPKREFDPAGDKLTWNQAKQIAEKVIDGGPYTNLSDVANLAYWSQSDAWGVGATEIDREAVIRNSAGLLTARHQLFTVFMRANAYSEDVGGVVEQGKTLATTHAVAELWRDPFPFKDASGNRRYRWLVRYFKMLED